jgi:hypothetical protein
MRRSGALAVLLALAAVLVQATVSAPARAAGEKCSSYPTPGSTVRAQTPTDLGAEYGVLRRPHGAEDNLNISRLDLSASGIVVSGIRFLARAPSGGRVYIIPAEHLLFFRLAPARCLPAAERPLERTLRPSLVREYAHQALCLVIMYGNQGLPTCGPAPGTFDPLLYAPSAAGLGIAPNGVPAVVVHYFTGRPRRVEVHHNFWIVNDRSQTAAPCGLDWIDSAGTVLRTVSSCTADFD